MKMLSMSYICIRYNKKNKNKQLYHKAAAANVFEAATALTPLVMKSVADDGFE